MNKFEFEIGDRATLVNQLENHAKFGKGYAIRNVHRQILCIDHHEYDMVTDEGHTSWVSNKEEDLVAENDIEQWLVDYFKHKLENANHQLQIATARRKPKEERYLVDITIGVEVLTTDGIEGLASDIEIAFNSGRFDVELIAINVDCTQLLEEE